MLGRPPLRKADRFVSAPFRPPTPAPRRPSTSSPASNRASYDTHPREMSFVRPPKSGQVCVRTLSPRPSRRRAPHVEATAPIGKRVNRRAFARRLPAARSKKADRFVSAPCPSERRRFRATEGACQEVWSHPLNATGPSEIGKDIATSASAITMSTTTVGSVSSGAMALRAARAQCGRVGDLGRPLRPDG
jgi:hypothetical protein